MKDLLYKKYLKKQTDIAKFQLNQQFILDQSKDDIKLSLTGIVQEMLKRINDNETKETIIAFTNYSTWGQRNNGKNPAEIGNLLDYVNWR